MKPDEVLIVKETDDFCEDMRSYGCEVRKAYSCAGHMDNSIRHRWAKYNLPFQSLWYNKSLKNVEKGTIIVYEPRITVDFMRWLRANNPGKRIIFLYLNIVKMSVNPEPLKKYAEVYTWDDGDVKEYGLKKFKGTYWPQKVAKSEKEYDVVFIGQDKGRLNELLTLEAELNKQGLKTYFHIVADHSTNKSKNGYVYKNRIPYTELLHYTTRSKAVVDMVQLGQVGTTLRTMESIFYGIKLISNNAALKTYDFYNNNNIFILGKDNLVGIKEFVLSPFEKIDSEVLESYTFKTLIHRL